MTSRERLNQVEKAIAAIEMGAQEYSVGGNRVKKADLSLLYQERNRLEERIRMEEGGAAGTASVFYSR